MSRINRAFLFLIFPGLALLWGIGWLLYLTGSKRELGEPKKLSSIKDMEIFVLAPEEKNSDEDVFSESLEA